jgi:hypothetical protein
MREVAYCSECGGKLHLYIVGVCPQCDYDLTGDDPERDDEPTRWAAYGGESAPSEDA